jgi:hypothetical protein
MGRLGLYSALIVVVFGVVAPFFIFKLGRLIGFAALLALAFVLGLGYGAVKAEYHWNGNGRHRQLNESGMVHGVSGGHVDCP